MQYLDFSTLIFFVAAVIVFLQLRGVLGKRTGSERPPFDPYAGTRRDPKDRPQDDGKVITLPKRKADGTKDYTVVDAVAPEGTEINKGLRAVRDADQSFNPAEFLDGAKMAYEMIVTAFADGDRKTLKNLLSKEVNDGFVAAINEREMRGERIESSFVGISKAEFADAEMKGTEANVTLRLVSQLISATIDKDGKVVDGDREAVTEVKDVWTFARDTRSRDPNWKLVATEAED